MPLYDIQCLNCQAINEMLISVKNITEDNRVLQITCPICDHIHLKKLNSYEGSTAVLHVTGFSEKNGYSK